MTMTTGPTPALMKQINEAFNSRDVDRSTGIASELGCTEIENRRAGEGPGPTVQAFIPPSTVRFAPVMYEDSGPATNATSAATSSTCP